MILSYMVNIYTIFSIIGVVSTLYQGTSDISLILNDERYSSSFDKDILSSSSQFISELMPTIISSLASSSSFLSPIILADAQVTLKRYSYICLQANQRLCLGLSPGNQPDEQPYEGLLLQIKHRIKNEIKSLDYKKMRWDIVNDEGRIYLSTFPTLCLAKQNGANIVSLANCDNDPYNMNNWYVQPIPESPGHNVIRMNGTNTCLSVHNCVRYPDGSCSPESGSGVALGTTNSPFQTGAHVFLNLCYDKVVRGISYPQYASAQTFTVELDCAAGCSPEMVVNGVCDQECNNEACKYDNGACAPTPSPHLNVPTLNPAVTRAPTLQPTWSPLPPTQASDKPTDQPTQQPAYTAMPTTQRPTTLSPTKKPTSPTVSNTAVPTKPAASGETSSPTASTNNGNQNGNGLTGWNLFFLIFFLILILCCCCFYIVFRKRRRGEYDQESIEFTGVPTDNKGMLRTENEEMTPI